MKNEMPFWKLPKIKELGQGGNGSVFEVEWRGGPCALKMLKEKDINAESYRRFCHEVTALQMLKGESGVLPILEIHFPEQPTKRDKACFLMPMAIEITKQLGELPHIDAVVEAISSIAETLARLEKKEICHRDIKPANLFYYDEKWVLGDFGLVDFPGKSDVTEGRALGSRLFIAPEMELDPMNTLGSPADVWSLAKTMWALATGNKFPPPYPMSATDPKEALCQLLNDSRTYLLDRLIEHATRKYPEDRITIQEFADELSAWLRIRDHPISKADVSDLVNQVKTLSMPQVDEQQHLRRSLNEASEMSKRLLLVLSDIKANLQQGFGEQKPGQGSVDGPHQGDAGFLLQGSGMKKTGHGQRECYFTLYNALPATHSLRCAIMIQVLDDGRHRLYAQHWISSSGRKPEVFWDERHEVDFGSSQEQLLLNSLVEDLKHNLRPALERLISLMCHAD